MRPQLLPLGNGVCTLLVRGHCALHATLKCHGL